MHLLHKNHSRNLSHLEAPNISCMHRLTVSVINISWYFCSLYSMYQTKFGAKKTKSKWNYTSNMIMNVSGTVCHHIHYFLVKQGLTIDLTWPALKVNNACAFWYHQLISVDAHLLAFGPITKYIINKISHSLGTRKGFGVNWTFKHLKWGRVKLFQFWGVGYADNFNLERSANLFQFGVSGSKHVLAYYPCFFLE